MFGYGEGGSLAEAKQHAYADLSEQLGVAVTSQSTATTQKNDTQVTTGYHQTVSSRAQAQLQDLEIACLDQQTQPGRVHIALRLDRRPLAQKIAASLAKHYGNQTANFIWDATPALAESSLLSAVDDYWRSHFSVVHNALANTQLAVTLFHLPNEQQWQLRIGNQPFVLSAEQLQLAVNWPTLHRGSAQLAAITLDGQLINRPIANEAEYRLVAKHPRGGYAHVIGIYENGELDVLRSNVALAPNRAYTIPETGGVFEAGALEDQAITTDTLVLLVTKNPLSSDTLLPVYRRGDTQRLQQLLHTLNTIDADVTVLPLIIQ